MESYNFPLRRAVTRNFRLGAARTPTVSRDGSSVLFLRSAAAADPVNELWQLIPATGAERRITEVRKLADDSGESQPAEELARRERMREAAGGITTYTVDEGHRLVGFVLSGSLFVVDVSSGRSRRIAGGGIADATMDPSGRWIACTRGGGVVIVPTDGGAEQEAIRPAHDAERWGTPEFIAAEEMGRHRGMWWLPDTQDLLITRIDERPMNRWYIADPARPAAEPREQRYPVAGSANARVDLFLVDPNGSRRQVTWDTDAFEYLARVDCGPGGDPVLLVQSRDQRHTALLAVDPRDATTRTLRARSRVPWIDLTPGAPRRTPLGIVDVAVDQDADCHRLMLVDGDGSSERTLSPPEVQVRAVVGTDDQGVWWVGSGSRSTSGLWFSDWQAETARHTERGAWSTGTGRAGTTVTSTLRQRDGAVTVTVTSPRGSTLLTDRAEVPPQRPIPEYLAVHGEDVDTAVLWPGTPQAGPMPILLSPYGGPHANRVLRGALPMVTDQWFADQGFCVVISDGPGTPDRPSTEALMAGDLAGPALAGQVAALQAVLTHAPDRVDPGRVGIRGWSFGGYLAALAVLERPDLFHAAVAGAPVTDWSLYDTHYTERYLGTPEQQPEAYAGSGLLDRAAALRRPLLLVHGLSDDNVVVAHTLRLSSALMAAARPHTVLPLSGVTHMTPQEVIAENLLRLELEFLTDSLEAPAGENEPT